jgi:hypothetical protein
MGDADLALTINKAIKKLCDAFLPTKPEPIYAMAFCKTHPLAISVANLILL